MRTVIEAVYTDMSDYVANNVIDWRTNDNDLYFREAASPNRTTYIPLAALKRYSVENVPSPGIGGRGLPIEKQL